MQFIRIEAIVEDGWHKGYSLDADAYLRELPRLQDGLPDGARTFALDQDHYNFFARKCVKDLRLRHMKILDRNDSLTLEIELEPNQFKHDQRLVIEYSGVIEFSVNVSAEPRSRFVSSDTRRLGDLQLDEILPHKHGCSHEIQLTGGSLWVVATDLNATWSEGATRAS
jgi:hypothetical protein